MKRNEAYGGKRRSYNTAGFTLIEVMLVVVILGILATVAMIATKGRTKRASIAATRMTIRSIELALDGFEVDNGVYPNSLQELMTDTGHDSWQGPYLKGKVVPTDAWNNPISYSVTADGYSLVSRGPPGGKQITN